MFRKSVLFVLFSLLAVQAFGQTIVVTSPAAGVTWRAGEMHAITWTKTGAMDDEVKIRLIQAGAIVLEIADNVPNTGSYTWVIPGAVVPGRYVVRVRTMNNAVMDNSDSFTIAAATQPGAPAQGPITLVAPNGKEEIRIGDPFRITWAASTGLGESHTADLLLFLNDRPVGVIAENLPVMQRRFEWTAGRLLTGTAVPERGYKVRIRVDGTTVQDDSDRVFLLVSGPPAGSSGTTGDLELVALEQAQNKVVARIRSTFPRFAGTAMYEMRRPNWAPTPVFRYPLSMLFEGPGEKTYTMETIVPTRLTDADFCGSHYEMYLDIPSQIEETNELNNHKTARLFGHPTFVIIERVVWGGQTMFKGEDNSVRSGDVVNWASGMPRYVNETLTIYVTNCGYMPINEGELRVSQIGVLSQERPQMPPTLQTKRLWSRMVGMSAFAEPRHHTTAEIAFDPQASEIRVEYIWEDAGFHTNKAVFNFNINYRNLF